MQPQKEYLTIEEAGRELGWDRSTVYVKMKLLGIQRTKFHGNRRAYLSRNDVDRLKALKETPWTAGVDKEPSAA